MTISLALLPVLGACTVYAAPAPQYYPGTTAIPICTTTEDLNTLRAETVTVSDGTPDLQAWLCTSSPDANCALTESATYTYSTSWSVGGGIDLKIKVSPTFEIQPKFQFGYSWTHTEGKGASARVECPSGGLQCGLVATPQMCFITGKVDYTWTSPASSLNCGFNPRENIDFKITSVCLDDTENSRNKEMNARVDFKACLKRCRAADKCDRKKAENLPLCPGVSKEEAFREAPPIQEEIPKEDPKANPCDNEPGEQKGQCRPEHIGQWNCVKAQAYQRCASGTWSGLTPLPAGTFCTCGYKDRSWDPANPGSPDSIKAAVLKKAKASTA